MAVIEVLVLFTKNPVHHLQVRITLGRNDVLQHQLGLHGRICLAAGHGFHGLLHVGHHQMLEIHVAIAQHVQVVVAMRHGNYLALQIMGTADRRVPLARENNLPRTEIRIAEQQILGVGFRKLNGSQHIDTASLDIADAIVPFIMADKLHLEAHFRQQEFNQLHAVALGLAVFIEIKGRVVFVIGNPNGRVAAYKGLLLIGQL
ncbi:hypothetical protein D3C78_892220 [compost metagenome]